MESPSKTAKTPGEPENWALRVAASTSSWKAKLRRIAGVKRVVQTMIRCWRTRRDRRAGGEDVDGLVAAATSPIDRKALADAEILLWRATQASFFSGAAERKKLAALNPFTAEDGLLRCGGRLARASDLDFSAKCPIILPHDSENVHSVLRHIHVSFLHAGVDQVLGESRRKYWIVKGRRTARGITRACIHCQKCFKQPQTQMMA